MRRLVALLGKEARQHAAFAIAFGGVLAGLYLVIFLSHILNPEVVSLMRIHPAFVWALLIVGGSVIGHRLVVSEYYGRTQLFLEALPVRRGEMVVFKYTLGLLILVILAGFSLGATSLAALSREALSVRFLGFVALRTVVFLFFGWSFLFVMGLVGRFRIPIYLFLILAISVIDMQTEVEMVHFGPIVLMDVGSLPFERETLPTRALLETAGLGILWTLIAGVLALIHEGSVAETLARSMSQREKALVGMLFVGLAMALGFLDEHREKEPYSFPEQAEIARGGVVPLEILYLSPERRDDAEALVKHLEGDLEPLRLALGWPSLPEVRVAYGPSLDADIYDPAELEDSDGILVRANFRGASLESSSSEEMIPWDAQGFSATMTGLVLDEITRGRASFEPKAWLRDGFAQWWGQRGLGLAEGLEKACAEARPAVLRALWTTRHETLDADVLKFWLRYRQRHGEPLAEAVALSGLLVFEKQYGEDAVLALARRVFGRGAPENILEFFHEWRHPMSVVFEEALADAGATKVPSWREFLASWNAELVRLRRIPACGAVLAGLPEGSAMVEIEAGRGTIRDVVYSYRFSSPPAAGAAATLLHARLSPFDSELEDRDLRRVENYWPEGDREASWSLSGYYGQGSRAFLALEIDSRILGCPIRLHAERRELE